MRVSLTLIVLVLLLLNILAGCAPGANQSAGSASVHGAVSGFWLGLWHGFIAPLVFVVSLFQKQPQYLRDPQQRNLVRLRYLFGVACFFGGGGNRTANKIK